MEDRGLDALGELVPRQIGSRETGKSLMTEDESGIADFCQPRMPIDRADGADGRIEPRCISQ
jgi:hypothetical protein